MLKKIGEFFKQYNDTFHKLTRPVRHAVAKIADKIGLHKLSDKWLNRVVKFSKFSAIIAGAHAGLWFLFGFGGLAAYGLHALGVAVPVKLGLASFYTGAVMGLKSVIFSGLFGGMTKRGNNILADRAEKNSKAIQPYIQNNDDLGSIPGIGKPFGMAATPEAKNDNTPAPQPAAAPPKVNHAP